MASQQPYQLYVSNPLTPALSDILILQPNDVGATEVGACTFDDIPFTTTLIAALAAKQATLVSATNIKTIAGVSVLGAGDIATVPITVKVSLSSAQILAGFTTPQTLVAAQGSGTFINVLSIAKRLTYGSITYITNTTDRVYIGSFSPVITDGAILASASTDFSVTSPTQSLEVSGTADWVNAPLMWKVITGNPASGNSTLDLYITYNVITF